MLRILPSNSNRCLHLSAGQAPDADAVWIDMIAPTLEEERGVERLMGLALPTREEMAEIEASSRVYAEDGGLFMTAILVVGAETDTPALEPVTFVLGQGRLATIRYVDPRAFVTYSAQVERTPPAARSGTDIFLGLLEALVDRSADVLEQASAQVDAQSRIAFGRPRGGALAALLRELGLIQGLTSKVRGSLSSLDRLIGFAALNEPFARDPVMAERLITLQHDIASLSDHAGYVSAEITFLLNAVLGLIDIEQNQIFKVLAAFSAVLMPPTLIAGVYGMNFAHMPELDWRAGYPLALLLMAAAMAGPLVWFKRKGWF